MTYEEAIAILDRIKSDFDPNLIGDIRPYAIDWIKEKLLEHKKENSNGQ